MCTGLGSRGWGQGLLQQCGQRFLSPMTSLHPLQYPVPSQKYQVAFVLFPFLSAQNLNDLHKGGNTQTHTTPQWLLGLHHSGSDSPDTPSLLPNNPAHTPQPFHTYLQVTEIAHVGPTAHVGIDTLDGNNANGPSMVIWETPAPHLEQGEGTGLSEI